MKTLFKPENHRFSNWYDMIYLTAIGFTRTPAGTSTVHIYTQKYIDNTNNT